MSFTFSRHGRGIGAFAAFFLLFSWAVTAGAHGLPDFTELAEQNAEAVVNISTTRHESTTNRAMPFQMPDAPEGPWGDLFRHFFGEPGQGGGNGPQFEAQSLGSGFIIDADGYIVTNNHVIEGADEIIVRLNDRRELRAELVGSDKRSDIALLKVEAADLPTTRIGQSRSVKVGEWVMAIGSPFGFDHSVSVGVVSALGRSLPSESYTPFIQTDVAINPGNSGGPLFNLEGEVVGINSQIYSRTGGFMGLSFAIPIDVAINVVKQLKERGRVTRGWLGVLIQDVTNELAESFGMEKPAGALVSKVLKDSPAAKGGLQVGDVIVRYNDQPVRDSSELPPLVGRTAVGERARMTVIRDGRERAVTVVIGELPPEEQLAEAQQPRESTDTRLGLSVTDLAPEQREQLDLQEESGVLVTGIRPGPAAEAGIRRGDVIVKLNRETVTSAGQFRQLARKLPAGKSVPVLVRRSSGPIFLALRVPE